MSQIILPNQDLIENRNITTSINPLEFDDFVCECGNKIYIEKIVTKKVPIYYQSSLNTDLIDFRFLVCSSCGELHEVFKTDSQMSKLWEKSVL